MTDREKSTPPPVFRPEDHLFRSVFTSRFESDDERNAVFVLGRMLAEYLNETHQWGSGTAAITGKLEAVATDLQQLADYLLMVGGERTEFRLEVAEDRLALLAECWSRELTRLAQAILGELRPGDSPGEPVQ